MTLKAFALGGWIVRHGAVQVQFRARMAGEALLFAVLRQQRRVLRGMGIMALRALAGFGRRMNMLGFKGLGEILVTFEANARLVHLDLLGRGQADGGEKDKHRKGPSGHYFHLWLPFLSVARMTGGAISFREWRVHVLLHHPRLLRSMRLMAKDAI